MGTSHNLVRFTAFSALGTITLLPVLMLPVVIGVLVDNAGMSESMAGWSAAMGSISAALAGILMALRVHRINLRQMATLALAVAAVADILSAFTAGETISLFVARLLSGLALGFAYAAVISCFGRYEGYERGFGLFMSLQVVVSGIALYVVPVYADEMGPEGLFIGLAVLNCIGLLLARTLSSERAAESAGGILGTELKILMTVPALLLFLGYTVFELATIVQFVYMERYGVALEISDQNIGLTLLAASLIGVPGAFSVFVIGERFGTFVPLVVGILVAIFGLALLMTAETLETYAVGNCCVGFAYAFCAPLIQSILVEIDRKGSAISAGSSLSALAASFGPGLAAIVVVGGKYEKLFLISETLYAFALAIFFLPVRVRRVVE